MTRKKICIIGSAHPDHIHTTQTALVAKHTTPATRQTSIGGVGFNMAKILQSLGEYDICLVNTLGNDSEAQSVLHELTSNNINCDLIQTMNMPTASYTAFHTPDGEMQFATIDVGIYNAATKDTFKPIADELLKINNWVMDTNFAAEVNDYLASIAENKSINIYVTISSILESPKIIPILSKVKALFGNAEEMYYLANKIIPNDAIKNIKPNVNESEIWRALQIIATTGVKTIIATNGPKCVYVLSEGKKSFYNTLAVEVKNVNGAGDSFAAAAIDRMIQGQSLTNIIGAGLTASALRIQGKVVNAETINQAMQEKIMKKTGHVEFSDDDLLISTETLREFLKLREVPNLESHLVEQLSPNGLKLIADQYNQKSDQYFPIYVACHNAELQETIQKIYTSPDNEEMVLIFQPTDGTDYGRFFDNMHKTVLYILKKDSVLHIIHADVIPFTDVADHVEELIQQALPDISFKFYKQDPVLHGKTKQPLILQTSYTECSTSALRIARKIAKSMDFIGNLELTGQSTNGQHETITYKMPVELAINASTYRVRDQLLQLFGGKNWTRLAEHYSRYPDENAYTRAFTIKYCNIIRELRYDDAALAASIQRGSVKNLLT